MGRATTRMSLKSTKTTTTTTTRTTTTTGSRRSSRTITRSKVEAAEITVEAEVEAEAAVEVSASSKRKATKRQSKVDAVNGVNGNVSKQLMLNTSSSRKGSRKRKVVKDDGVDANGVAAEVARNAEVEEQHKEDGEEAVKKKKKPRRKAAVPVERPPGERRYYLLKSEPESRIENGVDFKFGIDDLIASPDSTAFWDGVRNYQARNLLREMRVGDQAFFYHSNCKRPGIAGVIVKEALPDKSAFDPKSAYYDAKSDAEDPRWFGVEVKYQRKLSRFISLDELKAYKEEGGQLAKMSLLTAARLSVQRVRPEEWEFLLLLEKTADET
eukprot:jgi/Chlat1/8186/Chrsp76S07626